MSEEAAKYYTLEEYLTFEEKSGQKNEYYQGQLYQIVGGLARHNLIGSNINAALNAGLMDYPCLVFSSDMRILVQEHHLYTYADGSVVCGEVEFAHNREDTLINPILLIEVLSKSPRNYDRGGKFELYRAIEALQYYLIVDQERVFVEFHRKLEDGTWQLGDAHLA